MLREEDRRLLDAAKSYVRHRPDLFVDAARLLGSEFPVRPAKKRGAGTPDGFLRMEDIVRDIRSRLHPGEQRSDSKLPADLDDALRILLVAWLLDDAAHVDDSPTRLRPPGLEDLPFLGGGALMRLNLKYGLQSDPDWLALVRAAWSLAGDSRYLGGDESRDGHDARTPAADPAPVPRLKECHRRALASLEWLLNEYPDLEPANGRQFNREMHTKLQESECPIYTNAATGRVSVPGWGTWSRYLRECFRDPDAPKNSRRGDREIGRSIRRLDEL